MTSVTKTEEEREENAGLRRLAELTVYVIGGGHAYMKMFYEAGFVGSRSIEEADIICFTGGADVDPSFYGEKPHPTTHSNITRDEREARFYGEALALKKPMIGICRGSQFLNVMQGGTLWQNVNGHANGRNHDITCMRSGTEIPDMTSTHHQMMRPTNEGEVLALAALSTRKEADGEKEEREEPLLDDVEVVWYEESRCLCFQPHPEFGTGACQDYFLELVDEYVMPLVTSQEKGNT